MLLLCDCVLLLWEQWPALLCVVVVVTHLHILHITY